MRGNRLQALAGFLDKRFREYDFRRGAADARQMAIDTLGLTYDAGRPDGYYDPDKDDTLKADISTYAALDNVPSSRDPNRSVRRVFEDALHARLDALVNRLNPPGPNGVDAMIVRLAVDSQLAKEW